MKAEPGGEHTHCWHYISGWTNGMSTEGADRFKCCYCGINVEKKWTPGPDPAHGPYHAEPIRRYEKGWTP